MHLENKATFLGTCPECGSTNVAAETVFMTTNINKPEELTMYFGFECGDCGYWPRQRSDYVLDRTSHPNFPPRYVEEV